MSEKLDCEWTEVTVGNGILHLSTWYTFWRHIQKESIKSTNTAWQHGSAISTAKCAKPNIAEGASERSRSGEKPSTFSPLSIGKNRAQLLRSSTKYRASYRNICALGETLIPNLAAYIFHREKEKNNPSTPHHQRKIIH